MNGCITQKMIVDGVKNCYVLPNGMEPLEQTAATLELNPGIHVIRINKGTFSYFADGEEPRASVLLWIAGGKFTHNASKQPISAGWACLNGDNDTCTIEVAESTTVHALFLDTYRDDNQGKIELAVLSDEAALAL
jgi:hypothetical protein